jgi:hypothetical protein
LEKARARDGQREVAGDKGQWGFVLQGMRPAVAQAAEWWQGVVLITNPSVCILFLRLGFTHFAKTGLELAILLPLLLSSWNYRCDYHNQLDSFFFF